MPPFDPRKDVLFERIVLLYFHNKVTFIIRPQKVLLQWNPPLWHRALFANALLNIWNQGIIKRFFLYMVDNILVNNPINKKYLITKVFNTNFIKTSILKGQFPMSPVTQEWTNHIYSVLCMYSHLPNIEHVFFIRLISIFLLLHPWFFLFD